MKSRSWVSVHGGLGNQLFQLGLAKKLSKYSTVNMIPWIGHCRLNHLGEPWVFEYRVAKKFSSPTGVLDSCFMAYARNCFRVRLSMAENFPQSRAASLLSKILISIPRILGVVIVAPIEHGNFVIPKLRRRNYFFAYFQTVISMEEVRGELRIEHKQSNPEAQLKENDRRVLVVHVRRTDYRENPKIGMLTTEYFKRAFIFASERCIWDEIWLFSDAPEEAIEMIPKEFVDRVMVKFNEKETPPETLALMSKGDAYILSNSSFSWWAACLAENEHKLVIAPLPWFKHMPEPKGLIPSNWIRVSS